MEGLKEIAEIGQAFSSLGVVGVAVVVGFFFLRRSDHRDAKHLEREDKRDHMFVTSINENTKVTTTLTNTVTLLERTIRDRSGKD